MVCLKELSLAIGGFLLFSLPSQALAGQSGSSDYETEHFARRDIASGAAPVGLEERFWFAVKAVSSLAKAGIKGEAVRKKPKRKPWRPNKEQIAWQKARKAKKAAEAKNKKPVPDKKPATKTKVTKKRPARKPAPNKKPFTKKKVAKKGPASKVAPKKKGKRALHDF